MQTQYDFFRAFPVDALRRTVERFRHCLPRQIMRDGRGFCPIAALLDEVGRNVGQAPYEHPLAHAVMERAHRMGTLGRFNPLMLTIDIRAVMIAADSGDLDLEVAMGLRATRPLPSGPENMLIDEVEAFLRATGPGSVKTLPVAMPDKYAFSLMAAV